MVAENPSEMRGVEARAARGRHLGRTRAGQLNQSSDMRAALLSLACMGTPLYACMIGLRQ